MSEKKEILNGNITRIIIALSEIGNLDIEDFNLNWAITRTLTSLSECEKAYKKSVSAIQKKYINRDEKGNAIVDEKGLVIFKTISDKEKFNEEIEVLSEQKAEAKVWTIKTSQLRRLKGIKATTMAKCEELIEHDGPEEK